MDHMTLRPSFTVDLGAFDFSRGSLPPQQATPVGIFAAQPDLIVWNSISPRAGFAWRVPHTVGLVLRGTYFRLRAPLAGRYLDFGNANSLGGSVYEWTGGGVTGSSFWARRPGQVELGNLLLNFGGPYSSISRTLQQPYSDGFMWVRSSLCHGGPC